MNRLGIMKLLKTHRAIKVHSRITCGFQGSTEMRKLSLVTIILGIMMRHWGGLCSQIRLG